MHILKGYTKQEISWMMYDWANSAHSVIVVTILPIFFDTVAGYTADSVSSMSTWGFATSLAMAIVALSAPFLGVFGDIRGMRKKLFTAFMLIGVVSVAGLSFTPFMDFTASPDAAGRVAAIVLVLYITSTIGFAKCYLKPFSFYFLYIFRIFPYFSTVLKHFNLQKDTFSRKHQTNRRFSKQKISVMFSNKTPRLPYIL